MCREFLVGKWLLAVAAVAVQYAGLVVLLIGPSAVKVAWIVEVPDPPLYVYVACLVRCVRVKARTSALFLANRTEAIITPAT